MLNICILGQGTLAETTAECAARHFQVTREPTSYAPDLVWICYDTPLTADGADYSWVYEQIRNALQMFPALVPFLISSQMPVGTTAQLERMFPARTFAYSPENIRVATPISDFLRQERIVVGYRKTALDKLLLELFTPFTQKLIVVDPETAEMVKHALNAYLGMNIAFINEIARVAKVVGADMAGIEAALLSERRISPEAPLRAGGPFGKGHLARDLQTLTDLAWQHELYIPLIRSILPSNRFV